jgi:hypothetical protein
LLPGHPTFGPPGLRGPAQAANRGRKLETVGGAATGGEFQIAVSEGPIIGIAYQTGRWGAENGFGRIEPLRSGSQVPGLQTVVAKDGYAVGGFIVDTGSFFHAMRIIFMRIRADGRLDPDDTYQSAWIGTPIGKTTLTVSSKGDKVIGIHGRRMLLVHTIGLIVE